VSEQSPLTIVNLSHLTWERKLFQRPQQLASRFAAMGNHVTYFSLLGMRQYLQMDMEERIYISNKTKLTAMNLPFMPLTKRLSMMRWLTMALLRKKAGPVLAQGAPGRRVLWLQNPAYVDEIDRLPHDLLVYDVMDPFGAFKASDPMVVERQDRVLKKADIVFTGGRSLHSTIEGKHKNLYCFPSGIDFDHFSKGATQGDLPKDLADIPEPRLGYFGAVDERIDWNLIQHLCRERRNWHIVFLGPLVLMDKIPIDEPNFHWLGPKRYDTLPDYLRGFQVCLIPWLVNELTRYMSPTKTPEYLAAGRPVVSTPIPDVVADYPFDALTADTPEDFLEQCTRALNQGVASPRKPPQSRTWVEIAHEMVLLMEEELDKKK
jgi:glycosyltransferase involved in cell wall biosynthesis